LLGAGTADGDIVGTAVKELMGIGKTGGVVGATTGLALGFDDGKGVDTGVGVVGA
jgi:hypothetical protein